MTASVQKNKSKHTRGVYTIEMKAAANVLAWARISRKSDQQGSADSHLTTVVQIPA